MGFLDIDKAVESDLKTAFASGTENFYSVAPETTDAASETGDTRWINDKFNQYLGYYKTIPELGTTIDTKATWTVGKGFKASPNTTLTLDNIRGFGKDTFNTILENAVRTYHIGGDAFTHIIRDDDGKLINLKPLDPSVIIIVTGSDGIINGYEQISKIKGKKVRKFKPEEILHFARNRVADEIHGVSIIEKLENIIKMRNRAMEDWDRVLHRNIDPMMIYHLDTDDETKIAAFKAKVDAARGKGENMYIPKDAVVPEQLSIAPNSALNPLAWIESLNDYFYEAVAVPKIITGNSKSFTDASAKISYLAFQQTIEEEQLFIEEQVGMQLGMEIELEFPASLEGDLLSDKAKDKTNGAAQPNDTIAGREE